MPSYFRFCTMAEAKEAGSLTRWVDELKDEICVVSVDGKFHFFSSVCPHFGGPLRMDRKKRSITCDWHGWNFDLLSGNCRTYPSCSRIRHYTHREKNGFLEVEFI